MISEPERKHRKKAIMTSTSNPSSVIHHANVLRNIAARRKLKHHWLKEMPTYEGKKVVVIGKNWLSRWGLKFA
jgi:superfamily II DNA helicase RecQ